jgi:hypothetical protein
MERRAAGLEPAALLCCAPCAHASNGVFFLFRSAACVIIM